MAGIISEGGIAASQVTAPGIYVSILAPPPIISSVSSSIGGLVGSATWGPTNVPLFCGSMADYIRNFGQIPSSSANYQTPTAAAPINPADMGSYAFAAFAQATGGAGIGLWCVRVADSSAKQASVTLDDTTTPTAASGIVLSGKYSGTTGNGIAVTIAAGSKAPSGTTTYFTVTISPPPGLGIQPEVFANIPGNAANMANSPFWGNLNAAISNGIVGGRGPSNLVVGSSPSATAENPLTGTFDLTGGADGTSPGALAYNTSTNLAGLELGSSTGVPPTGMYALAGLGVDAFCLCGWGYGTGTGYGQSEGTVFAEVEAFAQSIGAAFISGLPGGCDYATATAVGTVQSNPDDWICFYVKDRQVLDDGLNAPRLFDGAPFALGRYLGSPPQNSLLNTTVVSGGSSRTSSLGSPAPYSNAEIGLAQNGRILLIAKPIPKANVLGFATGVNGSSNMATAPCEYTAVTLMIAKSLVAAMAIFVGGDNLQGSTDPDPVRSGVETALNNYLDSLKLQRVIDSYSAVCDLSINSPESIAAHYLYAQVKAKYLSSVWYFMLSFTGGTTVQVQVAKG